MMRPSEKGFSDGLIILGDFKRGCTRLADMLPSKYDNNALQIKEKSTKG